MGKQISIVLADDHELYRDGLALLLQQQKELQLLEQAANGQELLDAVLKWTPDIVITDVEMPVMDGQEACRKILQQMPDCRILALSMHHEDSLILDMLEAGARGYILKNADKLEVLAAIEAVMDNGTWFCQRSPAQLARLLSTSSSTDALKKPVELFTRRELDIIRLVCGQQSSREIGLALNLSIRTVEGLRADIMKKMKVHNAAGLVLYALKHGLYNQDQ